MGERELEMFRRKALNYERRLRRTAAAAFPVYIVIITVMLIRSIIIDFEVIPGILAVAAALSLCTYALLKFTVYNDDIRKFKEMFRDTCVEEAAGSAEGFSGVKYRPKEGLGWDKLKETYTVFYGDEDKYQSSGLLKGELYGNAFYACDVKTYIKRTGNTGRQGDQNIFSGTVMGFRGTDRRNCLVQVFGRCFYGDKRQWTQSKTVKTGNAGFDENFDVYAVDPGDVPIILTRERMDKITEFSKAMEYKTAITFCNGDMYAAADGLALFDPSVNMPIDEQKNSVKNDMDMIEKVWGIL